MFSSRVLGEVSVLGMARPKGSFHPLVCLDVKAGTDTGQEGVGTEALHIEVVGIEQRA